MYVIRKRLHDLCPCDAIHVPLDKTITALEEEWWGRYPDTPTFKSNSSSGTFHNNGAEILKAVNAQNRRCGTSRKVIDGLSDFLRALDTDGQE
jgi:hypothetical protein